MASITTRAGKGSPLTHDQVDDNFVNLNDGKIELIQNVAATGVSMNKSADFILYLILEMELLGWWCQARLTV